MDYLSAALEVLREAKRPLTVREITVEALRKGYLTPQGKTPVATMSARLYVACRDDPTCPIERLSDPGPTRAQRGSVRWAPREEGE
jgi:hypothetical protein